MVFKYINKSFERISSIVFPQHPEYYRSYIDADGNIITASSFDPVEFDKSCMPYVSTVDYLRSGSMPPKMGALRPNTQAAVSAVADDFVRAFNDAATVVSTDNTSNNVEPDNSSTN